MQNKKIDVPVTVYIAIINLTELSSFLSINAHYIPFNTDLVSLFSFFFWSWVEDQSGKAIDKIVVAQMEPLIVWFPFIWK